jgi:hypothetical protein
MLQWYKIIHIAETLQLVEENDALIWMWEPNGIYSVRSMYVFINLDGFFLLIYMLVNIHSVWRLKVPTKIHFFLRLVSHNIVLTRDNLAKRHLSILKKLET